MKTVLVDALAFRPPEMRGENYARAMFGGVINRREGRAHACVVFNFSIFDWDVEINANENAFAGKIEIFYRELSHFRFPIADCRLDESPIVSALESEPPYGQANAPGVLIYTIGIWQSEIENVQSPLPAIYFTRSRTRQE